MDAETRIEIDALWYALWRMSAPDKDPLEILDDLFREAKMRKAERERVAPPDGTQRIPSLIVCPDCGYKMTSEEIVALGRGAQPDAAPPVDVAYIRWLVWILRRAVNAEAIELTPDGAQRLRDIELAIAGQPSTAPPVDLAGLRALIEKWRGNGGLHAYAQGLYDCANDLERVLGSQSQARGGEGEHEP